MGRKRTEQSGARWTLGAATAVLFGLIVSPAVLFATHEADHRFTVEGFVCGADGKGDANVAVLVKDTRISYGQTVTTDGEGFFTATFHLHNDNLGDPLLVEAKGEQQNPKVQFDPKDMESERKIQVNFGSGCVHDRGTTPVWLLASLGVGAVVIGGFVGARLIKAWRKKEARREKGQGKRKK